MRKGHLNLKGLEVFLYVLRRPLKAPVERVYCMVFSPMKGGEGNQEEHWRKFLKGISW